MPPFAVALCPNCQHRNRFDLAELKKADSMLFKAAVPKIKLHEDEEFAVTCQNCGRKFKFTFKGGSDGKEK